MVKKPIVLGSVFFAYFVSFAGTTWAGDATLTLDDNAGLSSFVVQDVDKTNQFKVNSDGQGYFAGNVGIGATSPGVKLFIEGGTIYSNAAQTDTVFSGSVIDVVNFLGSDGYWAIRTGANNRFALDVYNSASPLEAVTVLQSGNVGIGTTSPSEKLEVSGNIKASGTVSQGSSREIKKNISYVSTKDAMKALNKLNPVRFEYKTDTSGEKHLGFIAEDVPDLVAEHDRKHLNAMDITAVLTKVVQEQQKVIQQMKDEILRLRDKVETFSKL